MKKFISFINFCIIICVMFVLVSCGHNFQTNTKGIGLNIAWQSDTYVPSLKLGYWDTTNATIRGNSTYTTTTATGGSLFNSGGTQTTTQLTAGLQLNQGNLVEILTNKENSDQVKIILLNTLTKLKTIQPVPTTAKTEAAEGGTGKEIIREKDIITNNDEIIQPFNQKINTNISKTKEIITKILLSIKTIIISLIIIIGIIFFNYLKKNKEK